MNLNILHRTIVNLYMVFFKRKANNYIVPLTFFCMAFASSAYANDLRIEAFNFSLQKNSVSVPSNGQLGYLSGTDSIVADFSLAVSWDCQPTGFIFKSCSAVKPASFTARIMVKSSVFERTLATVVVNATDIRWRNTGGVILLLPQTQTIDVNADLSDSAFAAWAANRFHRQDGTPAFTVIIDTLNEVAETDLGGETNNSTARTAADFLPLSGQLAFGIISTSLNSLGTLAENTGCGNSSGLSGSAVNLQLNASSTSWVVSTDGNWDDANLAIDTFCSAYTINSSNDALDLTALDSASITEMQGQLDGFNVRALGNTLDSSGATLAGLYVDLPPGHSVHFAYPGGNGGPIPAGSTSLPMSGNITQAVNGDYSTLSVSLPASLPVPLYIHADGLPFSIRLAQATLTSSSFTGIFDRVHYAYNHVYDADDGRGLSAKGPVSNDRRFSLPSASQSASTFSLTAAGLSIGNIDFDAVANAKTHYPAVDAVWEKSTIAVVDGKLADGQVTGAKAVYNFEQSADCAGCDAGVAGPVYSLGASTEGIASDGAAIAVVASNQAPSWGPWDSSKATHIFTRPDDALLGNAIFYLPGQIAQGTGGISNGEVARYLMGSRSATSSTNGLLPAMHYPLVTGGEASKGNYNMAGLTVGPEVYKDNSGLPVVGNGQDLTGTQMIIGFGGLGGSTPANYQAVISNVGNKYVVRGGGVTGVFNSNSVPAVKVYDYDINLSRFAFRQVNNIVDDTTWLDGSIGIAGKGNFNIDFASLGLDCSGDFSGGLVPQEACDGVNNNGNGLVDENCVQQSFSAWNADVDILSIAFVANDGRLPTCQAQQRKLQVSNTIDLKALSNKLGMTANWSPLGEPSNALITGSTDHVMDRPATAANTDEDRGFDVALDANALALKTPQNPDRSTDGWIAADADIMTPFWGAVPVSVRLANVTGGNQAQTIATARNGYLTSGNTDDEKTNAELSSLMKQPEAGAVADYDASYLWGATGFDLTLPVYYEAGRHTSGLQPRLLGRSQLATDLKVIKVNAGVDFITPEQTQVSFGASADFENIELLNLDLHVDLNDAASITKLDNFLCNTLSVPTCPGPVTTLVGNVRDKLNVLNLVSDAGLDSFLEQGLRAGLAALPLDAPLEAVSQTLGRVQAIPEEFSLEVSINLQDLANNIIDPLVGQLDTIMLDVYNNLPGLYVQASAGSPDVTALNNMIGVLRNTEQRLSDVNNAVSNIQSKVDATVARINSLKVNITDPTTGYVGQAKNAIQALTSTISTFSSITSCVNGDLGSNAMLTQINKVTSRVNDVKTELSNIDLVRFATGIATIAGVDMSAIDTAQRSITKRVEDMATRINQAVTSVNNLCANPAIATQVSSLLNDATTYLDFVSTSIDGVINGVNTVVNDISIEIPLLVAAMNASRAQIEGAQGLVTELRVMAENAVAGLNINFEGLAEINIQSRFDSDMLAITGGTYQWAYPTGGPYTRTFISEMKNNLRSPIDGFASNLSISLGTELAGLVNTLPHPSADDLRDVIVDKIMNSSAVETIDNLVYQNLSEIVDTLNSISLNVFDQLNFMVQDLIRQVEDRANSMLAGASGSISAGLPIKSASLDGYAQITGDELSRLHLAAKWTLDGGDADNSSSFNAALDVTSWNANNKGQGCGVGDGSGLLDARITASGLPFTLGGSGATIRDLELGFTLNSLLPQGVFGGIALDGELDFATFKLYDLAFKAGIGTVENYLGATGSAKFDDFQLSAGFLAGKTCNIDVLTDLDPRVGEFIGDYLTGGVFRGVYARGSASMPIYKNGCMLTVGVSADIGSWVSLGNPKVFGGLVGGGGFGKVACIASLRGQVTTLAQKVGDQFSFSGDGFGVAGVGSCSPSTWTSVARSREDGWCGTGDASFNATYSNGWDIGAPSPSAVH